MTKAILVELIAHAVRGAFQRRNGLDANEPAQHVGRPGAQGREQRGYDGEAADQDDKLYQQDCRYGGRWLVYDTDETAQNCHAPSKTLFNERGMTGKGFEERAVSQVDFRRSQALDINVTSGFIVRPC